MKKGESYKRNGVFLSFPFRLAFEFRNILKISFALSLSEFQGCKTQLASLVPNPLELRVINQNFSFNVITTFTIYCDYTSSNFSPHIFNSLKKVPVSQASKP